MNQWMIEYGVSWLDLILFVVIVGPVALFALITVIALAWEMLTDGDWTKCGCGSDSYRYEPWGGTHTVKICNKCDRPVMRVENGKI